MVDHLNFQMAPLLMCFLDLNQGRNINHLLWHQFRTLLVQCNGWLQSHPLPLNREILFWLLELLELQHLLAPTEVVARSEEHTSELQSRFDLVCRLLLEKKTQQSALMLIERS